MKRKEVFFVVLMVLVILLIGVPSQQEFMNNSESLSAVNASTAQGSKLSSAPTNGGNFLPEKIDPDVASSESILVRPKTNETLRKALMIKAFKGKNYAMSKALFKKALAKSLNLRKSEEIRNNLFVVSGAMVNTAKVKSAFEGQSYQLIEPNYKIKLQEIPINDAEKDNLWGLGSSEEYGINIEPVWEMEDQIEDDVIVAVIDTGVNCNHQDLQNVCWRNPNEKGSDGIDNDDNGYVDDRNGYNFVNKDNDPSDDNGHGTHVSGTIAAIKDNYWGIAGVTSIARILPIKAFGAGGKGYRSDSIAAIQYAIDLKKKGHNIRALNMSYGDIYPSVEEFNAIRDAGEIGITAVAAAGNENGEYDCYPAAYNLDNIISVAAHQKEIDEGRGTILSDFSNYGPTVHISAPGEDIYSLWYDSQTETTSMRGTSMATPHASGVVAILAGLFPNAKPSDYRNWIIFGGYHVENINGKTVNGTILDAMGAIQEGYKQSSNSDVLLKGYVLEDGIKKIVGMPSVSVELKINDATYNTNTTSDGSFLFSLTKDDFGKEYELTAYGDEGVIGSQHGVVAASDMLVPSLGHLNKARVKVAFHILDDDLKIVNNRDYYIRAQLIDKAGNTGWRNYTWNNDYQSVVDLRPIRNVIHVAITTPTDAYAAHPKYDTLELAAPTEEREIVFLPKGTEKVSQTTVLPAPFIAHIGMNSVEVNMKPFSGVDYNNKKGLVPYYEVNIKNEQTKESFSKGSYLPKLVIKNLEKGKYTFKYAVRFFNSKGQRASSTQRFSATKSSYVGYPLGTISPETYLYGNNLSFKGELDDVQICIKGNNFVDKEYFNEKNSIETTVKLELKNLETNDVLYESTSPGDNYCWDSSTNYDTIGKFISEPGIYQARYKVEFRNEYNKKVTQWVKSTSYSAVTKKIIGYSDYAVHPKMKLDFDLWSDSDYISGIYGGIEGYPIRRRYKITNTVTKEEMYEYISEHIYLSQKLRFLPEGLYEIQYQYEILDSEGGNVLERTAWSNYIDYYVKY